MTAANPWQVETVARPGTVMGQDPNHGTSTLLLPIRAIDGQWGYANGTVLMAGGSHNTSHEQHVDVYDPVAKAWKPRIDMGVLRHHPPTRTRPSGSSSVTV